jgi:hypothetical protein
MMIHSFDITVKLMELSGKMMSKVLNQLQCLLQVIKIEDTMYEGIL